MRRFPDPVVRETGPEDRSALANLAVFLSVSPALEPAQAVTHVAAPDAPQGEIPDGLQGETPCGTPVTAAILSEELVSTRAAELRALQEQVATPFLSYATRCEVRDETQRAALEQVWIRFAVVTRSAAGLPIGIQSAAVPWCEAPVATAWFVIHLEVAPSSVLFLMAPGGIRCGSSASESPRRERGGFQSFSAIQFST